MSKIKGTILLSRQDKILLLSDSNKYYIVKGDGERGKYVEFEEDESLPMPSYMFAIAAMEEDDLKETLSFIQDKWFNRKK